MATVTFPNSYLSTASQPWGRIVEKQLVDLNLLVTSNEINNAARDKQLLASLNRVNAAAISAQNAADTANAAIAGLTSLGSPSSSYSIAAGNITAGTLTGFTINTASYGQRIELGGTYPTDLKFYDSSNTITGSMRADSTQFQLQNTYQGNGLWGTGGYSKLSLNQTDAAIIVRSGSFTGSTTFTTSGLSTGTVYAYALQSELGGVSTTGSISNGGFSVDSTTATSSAIYNAATSQQYNMHIQGSANNYRMYRSTFTSTRALKRDIRPLAFDKDAYINISPVVFKYVDGVLREEEKDWDIVGFIAEDFVDAGLGEHLITQPQDEDDHISLRYDKMYMFLHSVVKSQQETITNLTTRLEAMENK